MNSMVPCRRPFYAGNLLPGLEFRQVRYSLFHYVEYK